MSTIHEEKAALRAAMRALPPPVESLAEGQAAAKHLLSWPIFQAARLVGCYAAMPGEIDTVPILSAILDSGKELALPKARNQGILTFHHVADPALLRPGRWGIPEPGEEMPLVSPEEISLLLIPALAVDGMGRRLGHGAGYYDRYLPQTRCPLAALVLGRQVLPAVPCGQRDYLVQWIITGQGIRQVFTQDGE